MSGFSLQTLFKDFLGAMDILGQKTQAFIKSEYEKDTTLTEVQLGHDTGLDKWY